MNTVRSVGYGWGVLIAAGGGAYFFAKRHVNADRDEKYRQIQEKRAEIARYSEAEREQILDRQMAADKLANVSGTATKATATPSSGGRAAVASPSLEANADPAPTRHAPTNEAEGVLEKSKYEASEVFRSRKGDRLR